MVPHTPGRGAPIATAAAVGGAGTAVAHKSVGGAGGRGSSGGVRGGRGSAGTSPDEGAGLLEALDSVNQVSGERKERGYCCL